MKKLKILVSAYACNPTGSLQLHPGEDLTGWMLVKQLSRFHDVSVITHTYNKVGVEDVLKEGSSPRTKFHFISLPGWMGFLYKLQFGQRIYYYFWQRLARKFAEKLHREIHFDVVHHVTFGNDWMPSFIGGYLPIPFIWGPVGGGQKTPKSLFKEYTFKGKIAELVRDTAQWIGRNVLLSRRRCLREAKAILVCNYETKAKIPDKYFHKVHLFPVNGISEDDLNKDFDKSKKNSKFLVLTAGRLHRLKGFDIAIRAFGLFASNSQNTTLEVIGQGPEELTLKELTSKLKMEDMVRFIPWLPRKELLSRMREADVFLFPSFRDGGGAVVVEAMASGIPVICLDAGGPGFHIQEEWGIKIEPKDPECVVNEMAKALEKLYLDKELRLRLNSAARKRAEEFYVWDKLGDRLMEIYKETLRI